MAVEPGLDRGQLRRRQVALQQAPDPWDVAQVLRLAVAVAEPREDADDLGVALRAEDRVAGPESHRIQVREGGQIALQHLGRQGGRDIAPGVLQERHQVVGARADHRVLEVEQAAGRGAGPPVQDHEVVHVIVAQHQGIGHRPGDREDRAPGRHVAPPRRVGGWAAGQRRHVPVGQQHRLVDEPRVVVGRQAGGLRHLRRRLAVQLDQQVGGQAVEPGLVRAFGERPGEGAVAQVFQQHEARPTVHGQRAGSAETELEQEPFDPVVGAHVLVRRRGVHQHGPGAVAAEPLVAAERGVAGQWPALGAAPPGRREEGVDVVCAIRHEPAPPRPPRCRFPPRPVGRASRRRRAARPGGPPGAPRIRAPGRAARPESMRPGGPAIRSG